jgi:hypothetical protein
MTNFSQNKIRFAKVFGKTEFEKIGYGLFKLINESLPVYSFYTIHQAHRAGEKLRIVLLNSLQELVKKLKGKRIIPNRTRN